MVAFFGRAGNHPLRNEERPGHYHQDAKIDPDLLPAQRAFLLCLQTIIPRKIISKGMRTKGIQKSAWP